MEDFIESEPDKYGDINHYRSKIYNPISKSVINEFNKIRKELIKKNKKSTDIIILTDTVAYGGPSNLMKTIQNNGGAIIAGYAGNPRLSKEERSKLDASLEPIDSTNYENLNIYKRLSDKGLVIYGVPIGESFENVKGDEYPLGFKVNPVDELTNIYHFYDDKYYNECIDAAVSLFDKYNSDCNKDNLNLVNENDQCKFEDEHAHGGYKCGDDGKWTQTCQISYCDIGYYYDKKLNKCVKDECIEENYPISELYQNVNSTYMKEVITDLLNISKSYVFSDIMNNPPSPYNDSKFNITEELEKIKIDEDKPFYEFYREIRTALSHLRDSNLDLIGGKLPFNEPINFDEYHFCLPFKFYLDYTNDQDINMYIKEYTPCIDNYGEDVKEFIKKQENISLELI